MLHKSPVVFVDRDQDESKFSNITSTGSLNRKQPAFYLMYFNLLINNLAKLTKGILFTIAMATYTNPVDNTANVTLIFFRSFNKLSTDHSSSIWYLFNLLYYLIFLVWLSVTAKFHGDGNYRTRGAEHFPLAFKFL